MNWCILIPLLVGLISAILGYLLGRMNSNSNNNSTDIDFWRNKNEQLEKDLAACKALKAPTSTSTSFGSGAATAAAGFVAGNASTKAVAKGVTFDAAAAKAAFGKNVKENDLKVVEGIGPKIAELFNDNGILTWAELANTEVATLQTHLDSKGERYRVHNPGTWPMQSGLAAEGKWAELKKWQDENDYGKA